MRPEQPIGRDTLVVRGGVAAGRLEFLAQDGGQRRRERAVERAGTVGPEADADRKQDDLAARRQTLEPTDQEGALAAPGVGPQQQPARCRLVVESSVWVAEHALALAERDWPAGRAQVRRQELPRSATEAGGAVARTPKTRSGALT